METTTQTLERTVTVCPSCGTVTAPDGTCLHIGTCPTADHAATIGAARTTAKFAVPAAWNARGGVD